MVFTNPVSKDREAEFNDWYDNIHAAEVLALPGFESIARLRAGPAVRGALEHRYLALYQCSDVDRAYSELMAARDGMNISDAMAETAIAVFFEDSFVLRAQDLESKRA